MKRFLPGPLGCLLATLVVGLALGSPAGAQMASADEAGWVKEPPSSEVRRFLTGTNRVLISRRAPQPPIPVVGGSVTVAGIGAFEPGLESQRLLGLEIQIGGPKLATETHYLDLHEIQSLLRAMAALRELETNDRRSFPTLARHVSTEGFGVAVALDGEATTYRVLMGVHGARSATLKAEDFQKLEGSINLALDRLFNGAPTEGSPAGP